MDLYRIALLGRDRLGDRTKSFYWDRKFSKVCKCVTYKLYSNGKKVLSVKIRVFMLDELASNRRLAARLILKSKKQLRKSNHGNET